MAPTWGLLVEQISCSAELIMKKFYNLGAWDFYCIQLQTIGNLTRITKYAPLTNNTDNKSNNNNNNNYNNNNNNNLPP